MKIADVRACAFAMPLNNPSYPPGPCRFYDREYFAFGTLMLRRRPNAPHTYFSGDPAMSRREGSSIRYRVPL